MFTEQVCRELGLRIKICDVGAMVIGDEYPYKYLLDTGFFEVIGFEPNLEECKKADMMLDDEKGKIYPFLVGNGRTETFYITNTGMTSSVYEPNHELLSMFQNLDELTQVVKTEEIKTVRLNSLPELDDVDFMKIDAQGYDYSILFYANLENVSVVQVEVEFVPMYKHLHTFGDIDTLMRIDGFVFHRFDGIGSRCFKPCSVPGNINAGMSQFLWADAVYIRDFTKLKEWSNEQLMKTAIILHEFYKSFDLCVLLIRTYDGRMLTNYEKLYTDEVLKQD